MRRASFLRQLLPLLDSVVSCSSRRFALADLTRKLFVSAPAIVGAFLYSSLPSRPGRRLTMYAFLCRLDGFIVQTTGIIVLSFAAMEMFAYTSTAFEYLTGGPPDFDASLVLLMLLSVSVLMDVWVTPIPFRFAYILPALIINVFLVAISVTISGEQVNSRAIFMLVGAVSLLVGYVFHIYGRAVYLWVHRKKILAELNPSSTPLTGPPVDAIPSL